MFNNFFVQPFEVKYHEFQNFFQFSIEGNRIYKELCAWVDPTAEGVIKVVVLLRCIDGGNILYVNNQEDLCRMQECVGSSDITQVFYAPIKLLTRASKILTSTYLYFRTHRSEKIEVNLYTIKKAKQSRRPIVRELNILEKNKGTLLVYSAKIMHSTLRSKVIIMGRPYEIKKNHAPIFFMRKPLVRYIRDMGIAQIKNSDRKLVPISLPDSIYPGAKFVYSENDKELVYTIEKVGADGVTIVYGKNRILAQETEDGLAIEKIFVTMHPQAPQITFTPPIKLCTSQSCEVSEHIVQLTMGKTTEQCDLTITNYKDKGVVGTLINPDFGWIPQFPLVFSVMYQEDEVHILNGQMENDVFDSGL